MSSTTTVTSSTASSHQNISLPNQPRTVLASLNYLEPPADGSKPYTKFHVLDPATGEFERNFRFEKHDIQIEDLRGKESSVSLDGNGFTFGSQATSVQKNFSDEDEIKNVYYPETIDIIKKQTGASRVVIFDHTIRRHVPGQQSADPTKRQPGRAVHIDQTLAAAANRVHRHLPADEAPELLKKRFQIINLWRPINHPAWDTPLALCDCTSVAPDQDLVSSRLLYATYEGENYSVRYNPEHRWKYVSGLKPEEYILIKCADSKEDVARLTPHTAFDDPSTPKDAPLRESIEVRTLVFYD